MKGDLDCKVHRGFYYAFVDISKQILSSVAEYKQKYNLPNLVYVFCYLGLLAIV